MRVSAYLEYYLNQDKGRVEEIENQMIEQLAPDIRKELIYDANGYFLEIIPWIKNSFSKRFLRRLSSKIHELKLVENDLIALDDEISLYFIEQGRVEIFADLPTQGGNKNGIVLESYRLGQVFGQYQFITN
jgi:hypothetical protein